VTKPVRPPSETDTLSAEPGWTETLNSHNRERIMNVPDQAFISAYCNSIEDQDDAAAAGRGSPNRRVPSAPQVDTKRYRIDAGRNGNSVSPPHVESPASPWQNGSAGYSVEVAMWDAREDLPADELLVSTSVLSPLLASESDGGEVSSEPACASEEEATHEEPPTSDGETSSDHLEEETETPESPAQAQRAEECQDFKPVWEVDRFSWPSEANQLFEAEANYFKYAGEKLRDACLEGLRVLTIASARSREGCTTLAMCLARAASRAGVKVALIDADLKRPKLATRLGMKFPHGWQSAVNGDVPLGETAITSLEDGVVLLPVNERSEDEITRLDDSRVSDMIQAVARSAELVVIDMGCLGENPEHCFAQGSACPVDAAIVVRNVRHTPEEDTLAAATRLKQCGIAAVGIAENFTRSESARRNAAA